MIFFQKVFNFWFIIIFFPYIFVVQKDTQRIDIGEKTIRLVWVNVVIDFLIHKMVFIQSFKGDGLVHLHVKKGDEVFLTTPK